MNHTSAWVDPMTEPYIKTKTATDKWLMSGTSFEFWNGELDSAYDSMKPIDKTAASDAALHRAQFHSGYELRDYPRTTQVERADHLPLLWALMAGGMALAVMAIRRILGRLLS